MTVFDYEDTDYQQQHNVDDQQLDYDEDGSANLNILRRRADDW